MLIDVKLLDYCSFFSLTEIFDRLRSELVDLHSHIESQSVELK